MHLSTLRDRKWCALTEIRVWVSVWNKRRNGKKYVVILFHLFCLFTRLFAFIYSFCIFFSSVWFYCSKENKKTLREKWVHQCFRHYCHSFPFNFLVFFQFSLSFKLFLSDSTAAKKTGRQEEKNKSISVSVIIVIFFSLTFFPCFLCHSSFYLPSDSIAAKKSGRQEEKKWPHQCFYHYCYFSL